MSYVYLLHLPNYDYAQFFGPKPQLVKIIFFQLKKFFTQFLKVYCHRCNKNRTTKLELVTGKGSWSCCILLGIFGLISNIKLN